MSTESTLHSLTDSSCPPGSRQQADWSFNIHLEVHEKEQIWTKHMLKQSNARSFVLKLCVSCIFSLPRWLWIAGGLTGGAIGPSVARRSRSYACSKAIHLSQNVNFHSRWSIWSSFSIDIHRFLLWDTVTKPSGMGQEVWFCRFRPPASGNYWLVGLNDGWSARASVGYKICRNLWLTWSTSLSLPPMPCQQRIGPVIAFHCLSEMSPAHTSTTCCCRQALLDSGQ